MVNNSEMISNVQAERSQNAFQNIRDSAIIYGDEKVEHIAQIVRKSLKAYQSNPQEVSLVLSQLREAIETFKIHLPSARSGEPDLRTI